MKVGGTATREAKLITKAQIDWVTDTFDRLKIEEFHHGACTGGDALMHKLALERGIPIFVHPPVNMKYVAPECIEPGVPGVMILPAKPYHNRNRDIVFATEGLIALPKQDFQPGEMYWGGTWYTVNYAERMRKPVIICHPNGKIDKREGE